MDFYALIELGVEVHVLRILTPQTEAGAHRFEHEHRDDTARARAAATSWTDILFSPGRSRTGIRRAAHQVLDPTLSMFPGLHALLPDVEAWMLAHPVDLIWVENRPAGQLVGLLQPQIPVVATVHDWSYRLMRVRSSELAPGCRLHSRLSGWATRRSEEDVVRGASVVTTGSSSIARDCERLGSPAVFLIPQVQEDPGLDMSVAGPVAVPRIVHLGAIETTANRLGIEAYLARVHPHVLAGLAEGERPSLWVVGDMSRAKPSMLRALDEADAMCPGFVDDLGSVLRPFDLSIIPYEFDTGFRTKIPLLFSYGQVVVTTRAASAGTPGLVHGENCIVLESLDGFPDAIVELVRSPEPRVQLGRGARATFEKDFLLAQQLDRYRAVLDAALPGRYP